VKYNLLGGLDHDKLVTIGAVVLDRVTLLNSRKGEKNRDCIFVIPNFPVVSERPHLGNAPGSRVTVDVDALSLFMDFCEQRRVAKDVSGGLIVQQNSCRVNVFSCLLLCIACPADVVFGTASFP
jgi:hypothetical protein